MPRSLRQRCLIHRCRKVLAKVPAEAQTEVRDAYWKIFDTEELIAAGVAPGRSSSLSYGTESMPFAAQYAQVFPSAVKCLLSDRQQLTS